MKALHVKSRKKAKTKMLRGVLRTEDGKKVKIYIYEDEKLYTPSDYSTGKSLYMHTTKQGRRYFYLLYSDPNSQLGEIAELISKEQVKDFAIAKTQTEGSDALTQDELDRLEQIFPGLWYLLKRGVESDDYIVGEKENEGGKKNENYKAERI